MADVPVQRHHKAYVLTAARRTVRALAASHSSHTTHSFRSWSSHTVHPPNLPSPIALTVETGLGWVMETEGPLLSAMDCHGGHGTQAA